MSIEIKVPTLPESVADATVAKWHKKPGEAVARDETLLELETEKVMLEVPAPQDGVLSEILQAEGSVVKANEALGTISLGKEGAAVKEKTSAEKAPAKEASVGVDKPAAKADEQAASLSDLGPAVRRVITEQGVDVSKIQGSGKGGRVTKEDVMAYIEKTKSSGQKSAAAATENLSHASEGRAEKRVPMSRIRARIAERLVEVQQTAAMLTTFNEVNLQAVMDLRARYKDQFEKTHGVKLGLMSFFVKAAVEALKRFPIVNASIDGNDIVYHGYYDIGIAVSTARGLVVPILRDADQLTMAEIEKAIAAYAEKARDGKLTMEEMQGGTFTITNGGIFGSMLSTPILNAPQSAILGMHNIVRRPVVENEQIVIRPIMYLAMSYDHRILDGRESVSFLLAIKQFLEDPERILIGV